MKGGERAKRKEQRGKLKGERWKVKGERWKSKEERWKSKDEREKGKSERWKVKNERLGSVGNLGRLGSSDAIQNAKFKIQNDLGSVGNLGNLGRVGIILKLIKLLKHTSHPPYSTHSHHANCHLDTCLLRRQFQAWPTPKPPPRRGMCPEALPRAKLRARPIVGFGRSGHDRLLMGNLGIIGIIGN